MCNRRYLGGIGFRTLSSLAPNPLPNHAPPSLEIAIFMASANHSPRPSASGFFLNLIILNKIEKDTQLQRMKELYHLNHILIPVEASLLLQIRR
ncbi:hypothetical protein AVEN_186591-1 [Araneus ventricosus]|uniref:Uncharacterized protein n=1 Tax=Araneus ventricosus TaxID=182803 RepID=A0A4Y2P4D7_ARAVE|nr:hypothetical protein AVEN_62573-1 [Araneus ventricosus]GBN45961.1 hypothetical protein AVEN_186591-1 [Araneus ventricosus]